jgi:chromosome segregation ATPase
MNKSKEENNQDIKPVRSEAVSNRGQRRVKGGSMLFSSTITIVNTIGIVLLGLWFFNTSGSQQQAGKSFIERVSMLEENISIQSSKVDDLTETNSQDLKFINKEIRKLWDLSNKKNRKSISQNLNSIESIEETLGALDKEYKTLSAKQRSLNLELAKLEKMQEKLNESLDIESTSSEGEDIEARLADLEEATKSMDLYRTQVNQSILSLKEKLNDLELEITNFSSQEATSNE